MTGDGDYDRRTVLKATGAALGGGVVAAGTASASHLEPTDCAVAKSRLGKWQDACPLEGLEGFIEAGTTGQVYQTCTDGDDEQHVLFEPDGGVFAVHWVDGQSLERC